MYILFRCCRNVLSERWPVFLQQLNLRKKTTEQDCSDPCSVRIEQAMTVVQ